MNGKKLLLTLTILKYLSFEDLLKNTSLISKRYHGLSSCLIENKLVLKFDGRSYNRVSLCDDVFSQSKNWRSYRNVFFKDWSINEVDLFMAKISPTVRSITIKDCEIILRNEDRFLSHYKNIVHFSFEMFPYFDVEMALKSLKSFLLRNAITLKDLEVYLGHLLFDLTEFSNRLNLNKLTYFSDAVVPSLNTFIENQRFLNHIWIKTKNLTYDEIPMLIELAVAPQIVKLKEKSFCLEIYVSRHNENSFAVNASNYQQILSLDISLERPLNFDIFQRFTNLIELSINGIAYTKYSTYSMTKAQLRALFNHIFSNMIGLEKLSISHFVNLEDVYLTGFDIPTNRRKGAPIKSLEHLRELRFENLINWKLTDISITDFQFPCLRILDIAPFNKITLHGLSVCLEKCPRIQELQLPAEILRFAPTKDIIVGLIETKLKYLKKLVFSRQCQNCGKYQNIDAFENQEESYCKRCLSLPGLLN